jgi:REP element-mobilizing transposase RayT
MRKTRFVNGEFYHVYNRGVDKRTIFVDEFDFARFIQSADEFNSTKPIGSIFENSFRKNKLSNRVAKLVDIVCYCLNPNHFHLILKQRKNKGISDFMRKLGTGFTQYFNFKYKRSGVLFQGEFKAKHVDSNDYLLHLSAYVNLNNKIHKIIGTNKFKSSWAEYALNDNKLCTHKNIILDQFSNRKEYISFAESSLNDILERKKLFKEIESLLIE